MEEDRSLAEWTQRQDAGETFVTPGAPPSGGGGGGGLLALGALAAAAIFLNS